MPSRRRDILLVITTTAASGVILALIVLVVHNFRDQNDFRYELMPAYDALHGGHLVGFVDKSPSYIGAAIWRAPFALIAMACGAGWRVTFLSTAIPCYAALPIFGVWYAARHSATQNARIARVFAVVTVVDPLVWFTGLLGHPEEIVGITCALAAVLVANDGRSKAAIALVLFAVLNKPGLAEVIPVVLVAARWRHVRVALVICLALTTLYALYNLTPLHGAIPIQHLESVTSAAVFYPFQLLWWTGKDSWLSQNEHVLLVPVCVVLAALWWWRLGRESDRSLRCRERDLLWLTAFVLLTRTAFDPWDNVYYNLPLVICLLCLEAPAWRLTALASLAALIAVPTNRILPISGSAQAGVFSALAVPALIAVGSRAYARRRPSQPDRSESLAHRRLWRLLPSALRPNTLPTSADSRSRP